MARDNPTRGNGLLESVLARERHRVANRLVPPSARRGRVLDIGCGAIPLFLLGSGFSERYGVDRCLPAGSVHDGPGTPRLIAFDVESGGELPYREDYFDVVTMLAVFEHVEPILLPGLLREIHRILKSGGLYILTTPSAWTEKLLRMMALLRLLSPVEAGEHKGAYTPRKIANLVVEGNFPPGKYRHGYFEMGANIWFIAEK